MEIAIVSKIRPVSRDQRVSKKGSFPFKLRLCILTCRRLLLRFVRFSLRFPRGQAKHADPW